jgi:exopolysaccharide production protein ExoF
MPACQFLYKELDYLCYVLSATIGRICVLLTNGEVSFVLGFFFFPSRLGAWSKCLLHTLAVPCRAFILLLGLALWVAVGTATAATISDYTLTIGDVLEFDFLDDAELPVQLTVGFGGRIQVPLLGAVKVSGTTIDEAITTIKKQLIDRELFVDPKIALSVSVYRPVFVIGDVRNPGSFPYHAQLTVEQSVGLAGGLLSVESGTESRIIARSKLQGELNGTDSEIAREAVWATRLVAQLDGRDHITFEDLPSETKPYLKKPSIDAFIAIENKILDADLSDAASQKSILSSNISATANQLELFDKLAQNQQAAIKFTQDERDRVNKLLKAGLKTANDLADIQRQLTQDEGRLLQILADRGDAVLRTATLKQQLATLEDGRKRDALIALQERNAMITRLLANRSATEEQLYLAINWASVEAESSRQSVIHYKIRARGGEQTGDQVISANNELLPGDVLIVSIEQPDLAKAAAGQ